MKDKIFGLQKNIFFLGLTSLFNDFSSEMVLSIFPAFFTSVLHAGAASLGLVDGLAEGLANFFKIYSGHLSDQIQKRKPLVVLGYTLSVITRPFYILVGSVGGALGLRVTDRIGKGLRDAPRDAIISLSADPKELGRSFGYHRAMDTIGAILGPLAAYLILSHWPLKFNYVFLTAFIIGILTLLTLFFITDVAISLKKQNPNLLAAFQNLTGRFKLFLLAIFILSLGSLPIAVLLLKTTSIGLLIASIPLFYMVYNLSYAGFSISAGKLSDRIGSKIIILFGYLILIGAYAILNFADSTITLLLAFLTLGLFPALTDGVQRSLAAQLTTQELRGGAFGWLNAAIGLGALLAGIGGGWLWQAYGPEAALAAASILIVIGLIMFILTLFKNKT